MVAGLREATARLPAGRPKLSEVRRQAGAAVDTVVGALEVDPTLLAAERRLRDFDMLYELLRQLRPLARQADAELQRRTTGGGTANRRYNYTAPEELAVLGKRASEIAQQIAVSAWPDWNTPAAFGSARRLSCPPPRTWLTSPSNCVPSLLTPSPCPTRPRKRSAWPPSPT